MFVERETKKDNTYTLPIGFLNIRSSVGGSVASASAPRVSMIKFTHSSCQKNTDQVRTKDSVFRNYA
jgi:hypothetical protein